MALGYMLNVNAIVEETGNGSKEEVAWANVMKINAIFAPVRVAFGRVTHIAVANVDTILGMMREAVLRKKDEIQICIRIQSVPMDGRVVIKHVSMASFRTG